MGFWWIILLWPLSGFLAWAWINYMVFMEQRQGFASNNLELKIACIIIGVLAGPIALLVTAAYAPGFERRCGLKFW